MASKDKKFKIKPNPVFQGATGAAASDILNQMHNNKNLTLMKQR